MQIGEYIRRAGATYGDAPALTEGARTLSFRAFDAATDRLGNALLAARLRTGRSRRRAAAQRDRLPDRVLRACQVRSRAGRAQRPRDGSGPPLQARRQRRAGTDPRRCSAGADSFDVPSYPTALEASAPPHRPRPEPTPAARIATSSRPFAWASPAGTTGAPKAVTLTTLGETAELSAFLMDLVPDLEAGGRFLHAAPIAHASGRLLPALAGAGRRISGSCRTSRPPAFVDLAERRRAQPTPFSCPRCWR